MIRISNIKFRPKAVPDSTEALKAYVAALTGFTDIAYFRIAKRSVDARKKENLAVVYVCDVALNGDESRAVETCPYKDIALLAPAERCPEIPWRPGKALRPVIIGTGANSTATAVENSVMAEKIGADAVLVVTPYYNKATQDGLVAHYSEIAKHISLDIIAYNVPGRTGVNLLPKTFARLAEIKNVAAIKEASGNMEQIEEVIRLTEGKAYVYSGDDSLTVPTLAMGGLGVISVASNVIPKYVSDMCKAFFDGDIKTAAKMQRDMLPFVKALFMEVNPIPVKKMAETLGICQKYIRLPLTEMTAENTKVLINAYNELIKG